ncbi:BMP family ABC transporter substrate-binding protein [Brucepastera parasyntrophica]|uniref:BMP family lipoprotein n=1 Tax=Brucepastera parasyntrophica TaxID=2880008 RepID=UPI00210D0657|nr:BMP family ABC transporter substrate-binding protein [Brucepastera parasyntrophica]ULQ60205.1 BMP family ABC transporter substrate-binding protein [Brucepastera parasyntrophica]
MKRICAVVLILGMVFSVFAGGGKDAANTDGRPTIRLITDATGVDDKSFNAAAWRGILSYYGDTWDKQTQRGKLYNVMTCQTQDRYVPVLRQASDEGPSLICVTGFTFADALTEVADMYPNQKYMIVDVDWVTKPNVMQFTFSEHEGSYLVGVAAALRAVADGIKNPKFGFIGGIPGETITKFEMGYIQGIRSVIPNAEIVDYYANDWGKPELAKVQAKNWYDSGVYAIYSAAGGTGNGTIAQAKEYRNMGRNVWAIGVDSDQYEEGIYTAGKSAVLTSMLKRVEAATMYALNAVQDKTFAPVVIDLNLASDGVGFSEKNAELGADIIVKVNAVKRDIVSKKIHVYATYKDALAAGAVPAGLGAKDN